MDVIQRARRDLTRLTEFRARLREQLSRVEEAHRRLEIFLEVAAEYGEAVRAEEEVKRDSKSARIRELAAAAINEAGRSLGIHDIVAYIESNGEEIAGKDKISYVLALLSRDRRFTHTKDQGWSVIRPLPRPELVESLERRLQAINAPLEDIQESDA